MNQTYYIVAIKNTINNAYYLCTSPKKEANTLSYFLKCHQEDPEKYVKLSQSVKEHGIKNFVCSRIPNVSFKNKDEAELVVFQKLLELPEERVLNDRIINNTRVPCPDCNKSIRQEYLESHMHKYCTAKAFSDLTF